MVEHDRDSHVVFVVCTRSPPIMSSFNVDSDIFADASFPLPFRVLVLAGLGILGWATNVHGLQAYNIDVVGVMDLGHPPKSPNSTPDRRRDSYRRRRETPLYVTIYAMCLVYFIWVFMAWSVYVSAIHGTCCAFFFLFQFSSMCSALSRCLFPDTKSPVLFADVVFADIFTSFAKVLGDCWLSFLMLLPGNSFFIRSSDSDWKRWILPSIMRYILLVSVAKYTQGLKSALLSAISSMPNRILSSIQQESSTTI